MRFLLDGVGKAGPERDFAAGFVEGAAAVGRAIGSSGVDVREAGESRADAAWPKDEAEATRGLPPPRM
jgi:hypothetical protein